MDQLPKRDIEIVVYPACLSPESLAMNKFYFGRSSGSLSVQHLPIPPRGTVVWRLNRLVSSYQFIVASCAD